MTAQIIRGDALDLPLADSSVDLVVTSPPYFGLRSYQDGGEHYDGQIGAEATPAEFVDALIAATREMVRVLKPSGSIWVNLGDKYAGSPRNMPEDRGVVGVGPKASTARRESMQQTRHMDEYRTDIRAKSLMGIPWRYAIRCIDDLGLILRAEVIWSKPNGLPESVTDRVRRSHEQWFHFTLNPRYYSAVDEIREEHRDPAGNARYAGRYAGTGNPDRGDKGAQWVEANPLGKLPGSVWTIPTEPLRVPDHLGIDHFAAFPTEWPRRIITGWSPAGVCVECGEGRRPVVDRGEAEWDGRSAKYGPTAHDPASNNHGTGGSTLRQARRLTLAGESCACPDPTAPTTPGVVLDPFGGTGTTALVASALGRHGVSVDMSADYCRLAEWRTSDPKQRAKAARKPFTPPAEQIDGQASLLDLLGGESA